MKVYLLNCTLILWNRGQCLEIIKNYSIANQQRNVINEQSSSWQNVTPAVPQSSVLGPLSFLIYINHLLNSTALSGITFADDTFLKNLYHTNKNIQIFIQTRKY